MANVVLVTILLVIVILVGGGFFLFNSSDSSSNSAGGIFVSENSGAQDTNPPQGKSTSSETEEVQETKEFDVIAKQWDFSPSTITVNQGDKVILNVESIDVDHGIAIPEFGVSERLVSGNNVKIEFTADKKGTFSFFCNVSCGSGHGSMKGTLVVQ